MTSRARTPAGLLGLFVCLVVVAAAVTALPPAAGAATPLQRSSRSASSSAADNPSPAATLVVVIAGTARPVIRSARPHLPSSAAESRSPRHAFRAAPFAGHPTVLFVLLVVPARGPRAPSCAPAARDRFAVAGGDPVNGGDPSGEIDVSAPPGGSQFTIEQILEDPSILDGLNPEDLISALGGQPPPGWVVTPGQGESVAPGWVLREWQATGWTGRLIRWGASLRPGHPDGWYWTVSSPKGGKVSGIEAGNWPDGPEEYVGSTGGVLGGAPAPPSSASSPNGGGGGGGGADDPCLSAYQTGVPVLAGCGGGGWFGDFGGEPVGGEEPPIVDIGYSYCPQSTPVPEQTWLQ